MSELVFSFFDAQRYFKQKYFLGSSNKKRNCNLRNFLWWSFENCWAIPHQEMQPFEFKFSEREAAEELNLTRRIIEKLLVFINFGPDGIILESTSNSIPYLQTYYKWKMEVFRKKGTPFYETNSEKRGHQNEKGDTKGDTFLRDKFRKKGTLKGTYLKNKTESCSKETSKEKSPNSCSSSLGDEGEESVKGFQIYLASDGITEKTIRRWVGEFGVQKLQETILLMKESKTPIPNPGGWIERALERNYVEKEKFKVINLDFAILFKSENKISSLKINKTYCVDKDTGNDYQYNLDPKSFKDILTKKYEEKVLDFWRARKIK